MDITKCKNCKRYSICEETDYLNYAKNNIWTIDCEMYDPLDTEEIDNTVNLPTNDTIFIKSISTTEGIYECARFTGTLEDFLTGINSNVVIPLYFPKEDKTVFINSIYIISFEY